MDNIRDAQKWEEIEERLTAARAAYKGSKDGIKYYEREVYTHEIGTVVARLLDLIQDPYLLGPCVVKLLVTSPLETRIVRRAFAGCIMSMSSAGTESCADSRSSTGTRTQ